jgi:hypothetical protein
MFGGRIDDRPVYFLYPRESWSLLSAPQGYCRTAQVCRFGYLEKEGVPNLAFLCASVKTSVSLW